MNYLKKRKLLEFKKGNRERFFKKNFIESEDIKWDYVIDGDYLREKIKMIMMKKGGDDANSADKE